MLWMVQKVFFGQITHHENSQLSDVNGRELAVALPFVALVLVMGLVPQPFLDRIAPSTERFIARAQVAYNGGEPNNLVPMNVMALPPAEPSSAPSEPARIQAAGPSLPVRPTQTPRLLLPYKAETQP